MEYKDQWDQVAPLRKATRVSGGGGLLGQSSLSYSLFSFKTGKTVLKTKSRYIMLS